MLNLYVNGTIFILPIFISVYNVVIIAAVVWLSYVNMAVYVLED